MAHGGKREGSGRKAIAEELNTREIAIKTLVTKFGDKETALYYLVDSGEPTLIKFVYEHAFGKPLEKQEVKVTDATGGDTLFIEK